MDVSAMELSMLRNMIIKTGRPPKKWIEIVKEKNFVEKEEIVKFLKDEHSGGHFYAYLIAKKAEQIINYFFSKIFLLKLDEEISISWEK